MHPGGIHSLRELKYQTHLYIDCVKASTVPKHWLRGTFDHFGSKGQLVLYCILFWKYTLYVGTNNCPNVGLNIVVIYLASLPQLKILDIALTAWSEFDNVQVTCILPVSFYKIVISRGVLGPSIWWGVWGRPAPRAPLRNTWNVLDSPRVSPFHSWNTFQYLLYIWRTLGIHYHTQNGAYN